MAAEEHAQTLQREADARFTVQQRTADQVSCGEACMIADGARLCSVAATEHEVCSLPQLRTVLLHPLAHGSYRTRRTKFCASHQLLLDKPIAS